MAEGKRLTRILRIIIAAAVLAPFVCLAWYACTVHKGASPAHNKDEGDTASRALVCDKPMVDLGTKYRPVVDPLRSTFRIVNNSPNEMGIRVAQRSCDCADTKLSAERVEPGEAVVLTVDWLPPNVNGKRGFEVYLESDVRPPCRLKVGGYAFIRDTFHVTPERIDFGEIVPDDTKSQLIDVWAPEGEILGPGVRLADPGMTTPELTAQVKDRSLRSMTIAASLKGVEGLGARVYVLSINTGRTAQPVLKIPMDAKHLAEYVAKPDAVMINRPTEGTVFPVNIRSTTGKLVEIERIALDDPSVLDVQQRRTAQGALEIGLSPRFGSRKTATTVGTVALHLKGCTKPLKLPYVILW